MMMAAVVTKLLESEHVLDALVKLSSFRYQVIEWLRRNEGENAYKTVVALTLFSFTLLTASCMMKFEAKQEDDDEDEDEDKCEDEYNVDLIEEFMEDMNNSVIASSEPSNSYDDDVREPVVTVASDNNNNNVKSVPELLCAALTLNQLKSRCPKKDIGGLATIMRRDELTSSMCRLKRAYAYALVATMVRRSQGDFRDFLAHVNMNLPAAFRIDIDLTPQTFVSAANLYALLTLTAEERVSSLMLSNPNNSTNSILS